MYQPMPIERQGSGLCPQAPLLAASYDRADGWPPNRQNSAASRLTSYYPG